MAKLISVESAINALEIASDRVELALDFHAFVEAGWPILEPANPFKDGFHIHAICDHLDAVAERTCQRLIINMPPRHGKSLLVAVFWPAWIWTTRPWERFIFSSYAQTLSVRDSRKFRILIKSDWYQERWGDLFTLSGDQNSKLEIVNSETGHRIATSTGASATGKGGGYVVVDDPLKASHAGSKAKRDEVKLWWSEEMSTRGNTADSCKVIVMQRLHHDDLSGACLGSAEPYTHLNLPARYEGNDKPNALGWRDPRTEDGELLWPLGFPEERLQDIERALGSQYAIAGQLQQRPVPRGGGIIKAGWFVLEDRLPSTYERMIISADFSHGSQSRAASFNVFSLWGQNGSDVYLVDLERFKGEFPEGLERFKRFCARHKQAFAKLVEDKAMGRSVIQTLKRTIPGMIPINPGDRDKLARLESVSPFIRAGNVHILRAAPWRRDFVFELSNFPGSKTDDQVDVTSQALQYLQTSGHAVRAGVLGGR